MKRRVAIPSSASGTAGSNGRFSIVETAHTNRTITLIATPSVRLTVAHVQMATHGSFMHRPVSFPCGWVAIPDGTGITVPTALGGSPNEYEKE